MTRRRTVRRRAPHANPLFPAFCIALLCCCAVTSRQAEAASLEDYRARVSKAREVLEELHWTFDEIDHAETPEFLAQQVKTFADVRAALPATEKIEGAGAAYDVDNRWLHGELDLYEQTAPDKSGERDDVLYRLAVRLHALDTQLAEAANARAQGARDKEAEKGRLQAILRRPEYNRQAAEDTALAGLWKKFKEGMRKMMPASRPLNQGTASAFSLVAQLFVFVSTIALIIFVVWKFGARLLPRNRAQKKKPESGARVVLGERLAPGQTPAGLISEAEALARAGDIRGAIRKAYIAVLFELGERHILRLAAHKTNRDYLSAIRRERAALYDDMQPLTHNYERHWYGFAPATDADWHDFRSRCQKTVTSDG